MEHAHTPLHFQVTTPQTLKKNTKCKRNRYRCINEKRVRSALIRFSTSPNKTNKQQRGK